MRISRKYKTISPIVLYALGYSQMSVGRTMGLKVQLVGHRDVGERTRAHGRARCECGIYIWIQVARKRV